MKSCKIYVMFTVFQLLKALKRLGELPMTVHILVVRTIISSGSKKMEIKLSYLGFSLKYKRDLNVF